MSVISNNQLAGAAGQGGAGPYEIQRSLRFNSEDSAHLSRTPSSAGNRRTWTFSCWAKRTLSAVDLQNIFCAGDSGQINRSLIRFNSAADNNKIAVINDGGFDLATSAVFRDPSAWYHLVWTVDTTESTAADRVKLWVNGVQHTLSGTTAGSNEQTNINNTKLHYVGRETYQSGREYDGYLADVHLIDGQALAATDFGEYDDNNVWQPKAYSGTYGTNGFRLDFSDTSDLGDDAAGSNNWTPNNFATSAPGLSTANQGFDAVTWTGNGGTQSITGLSFQPDFVWTSVRDATGYNKYMVDSVRGSTKVLVSHKTDTESTQSTGVTGFTSNGFNLGSNAQVNENGRSMVAWCWKAGGSASTNTNGTIQSSVSANTTYGFSVVTYSGNGSAGATVGHGLGSTPKFMLVKNRSASDVMVAYHASVGNTGALRLTTAATDNGYNWWNSTTPSDSVFTVGTTGATNGGSGTYVAYCWSEVSGFSKFGSYSGNGQTLGPKVTTNFKPRFVALKRTDSAGNWEVYDSARSLDKDLKWNTNEAEGTAPIIFHSDGFQTNYATSSVNANGGTYVYMAFASKPDESIIDSLLDTPTDVENDSGNNSGNYATYNPLSLLNTADTLSEGNLKLTSSGSGMSHMGRSTISMKSGKWYWEVQWVDTQHNFVGIVGENDRTYNNSYLYLSNAKKSNSNGNSEGSSYGATWGDGDIIGVAFDADNGTLTFYKNGVSQGTAFTGIATDGSAGTLSPYPRGYVSITGNWNYQACTSHINFGQRPFAISSIPTGYKSLCTANLADPTIADGSTAMDVSLWSGNGSTQGISGLNFSPDFVWIKRRSSSYSSLLYDTVRGNGPNKGLISDSTTTEGGASDNSTYGYLDSFDSDGFSLVAGSTSGYVNASGQTYVGWAWDAGSSNTTNTSGNIQSTVRANTSTGFSIVTYTGNGTNGATVGHGLSGVENGMIIVKNRTSSLGPWWAVYHHSLTSGKVMALNSTQGEFDESYLSRGIIESVTSSTFSCTSGSAGNQTANGSGDTHVAYCFAPVEGYSAFGSYLGNGSSTGPFVYTGFKPKWIMIKRANSSKQWVIMDTERDSFNVSDSVLQPNVNSAEWSNSENDFDILSNGFKMRNSHDSKNGNGDTYIYAAFAEHPLKYARAR